MDWKSVAVGAGVGIVSFLLHDFIGRRDKNTDENKKALDENSKSVSTLTITVAVLTNEIKSMKDALAEIVQIRKDVNGIGASHRVLASQVDVLKSRLDLD